jgi:hypothetical protein
MMGNNINILRESLFGVGKDGDGVRATEALTLAFKSAANIFADEPRLSISLTV